MVHRYISPNIRFGYARVATHDQIHALPLDALMAAGCAPEHIHTDTCSSVLVDLLCGLTRSMIHIVVNEEADVSAILGPPLPPDELTMGDYVARIGAVIVDPSAWLDLLV